jgi:hypothetical protein
MDMHWRLLFPTTEVSNHLHEFCHFSVKKRTASDLAGRVTRRADDLEFIKF